MREGDLREPSVKHKPGGLALNELPNPHTDRAGREEAQGSGGLSTNCPDHWLAVKQSRP